MLTTHEEIHSGVNQPPLGYSNRSWKNMRAQNPAIFSKVGRNNEKQ
jgi:hypothetical protein